MGWLNLNQTHIHIYIFVNLLSLFEQSTHITAISIHLHDLFHVYLYILFMNIQTFFLLESELHCLCNILPYFKLHNYIELDIELSFCKYSLYNEVAQDLEIYCFVHWFARCLMIQFSMARFQQQKYLNFIQSNLV